MIFTIIASFFIAMLSGMGVGGGGLFIVFLNIFTDTPQLTAQGINLLFFLFSSGSAVCIHLSRRVIYKSAVLSMILFGLLGAISGSLLSSLVPQSLLRKIFGAMLVASGILSLKQKSLSNVQDSSRKHR